jgi:hypothetical protein
MLHFMHNPDEDKRSNLEWERTAKQHFATITAVDPLPGVCPSTALQFDRQQKSLVPKSSSNLCRTEQRLQRVG